jgi:hypothetical protein
MSWLFLIGVACDGIGAFMIAWPILRPSSAAREAGRPRWGGDHCAPFVRDLETRLIRCRGVIDAPRAHGQKGETTVLRRHTF